MTQNHEIFSVATASAMDLIGIGGSLAGYAPVSADDKVQAMRNLASPVLMSQLKSQHPVGAA